MCRLQEENAPVLGFHLQSNSWSTVQAKLLEMEELTKGGNGEVASKNGSTPPA
jgi:hypothetical protein